jgi:hypothetical protein
MMPVAQSTVNPRAFESNLQVQHIVGNKGTVHEDAASTKMIHFRTQQLCFIINLSLVAPGVFALFLLEVILVKFTQVVFPGNYICSEIS